MNPNTPEQLRGDRQKSDNLYTLERSITNLLHQAAIAINNASTRVRDVLFIAYQRGYEAAQRDAQRSRVADTEARQDGDAAIERVMEMVQDDVDRSFQKAQADRLAKQAPAEPPTTTP